jgi:hypothetical protein
MRKLQQPQLVSQHKTIRHHYPASLAALTIRYETTVRVEHKFSPMFVFVFCLLSYLTFFL